MNPAPLEIPAADRCAYVQPRIDREGMQRRSALGWNHGDLEVVSLSGVAFLGIERHQLSIRRKSRLISAQFGCGPEQDVFIVCWLVKQA